MLIVTQSGCSWLRRFGRDEPARITQTEHAPPEMSSNGSTVTQRPTSAKRRWPGLPRLLKLGAHRKKIVPGGTVRSDDPDESIQRAEQAFQQQRFDDAVEHVATALELNPEHSGAWLMKGRLEESVGRHESALEAFHRAVSCDGAQPEASLCLARLQIEDGQAARSAPVLRAILDSPQTTEDQKGRATWLLGIAYTRTGRWDQAAPALIQGADKRQMTPDDWYLLSLARYKAGDITGARHDLQRLVQAHPNNYRFVKLLDAVNGTQGSQGEILPAQNIVMPEEPPLR